MSRITSFKDFIFESVDASTLKKIADDMRGINFGGDVHPPVIDEKNGQVRMSIRNLGNWEHDEESHYGDEDGGWREDDDQMIWAGGEYRKYLAEFKEWAENKSWVKSVTLRIEPSEKCWCDFVVAVK